MTYIMKHNKIRIPKEIEEFFVTVFEIVRVRRLVIKVDEISFIVHSNEQNHHIPHIHAKYGKYEVSIAIESGKVLAGNLPPKNQKKAVKWVLNNKKKLLSDWKDYALSASSITSASRIYRHRR